MDADESNIFEDEVIADSEEETEQNELRNQEYGTFQKASSISAFTTAGYPQRGTFSAISAFSGDASVLAPNDPSTIEPGTSSRAGDKESNTSIISNADSFLDGLSATINIADRAKMRQRSQKQAVSDVIELTSDEDDELIWKPSTSKEKKAKSSTKSKSKKKEVVPQKAGTSTDTDAVSAPKTKPRPRPRPIPKQPRYGEADTSSSFVPDIPIATPSMHTAQLISSLPPSDPPQHTEPEPQYPGITTLQPSSPNSLFNEGVSIRNTDMEVDELASDVPYRNNANYFDDDYISPRKMPPPPTFFAGSSSSSMGGGKGDEPITFLVPQQDIVDLTMLPPTIAPAVQKKEPKPKKPKKKKEAEHDYDYDFVSAPLPILDEDDQDEDFDPTGDGNAKKKKKGKGKEKGKEKEKPAKKSKAKSKASDDSTSPGSGGAQVEVVITSKPPKSKGKGKAAINEEDKEMRTEPPLDGGNKESFKSREFIEDSDEDDPIRLVGSVPNPPSPLVPITPAGPSRTIVKDTKSPTSLKIRLPGTSSSRTPAQDLDSDTEMKEAIPSKSKGNKKRKTVVDSDEEEDFYVEEKETPAKEATSASKKRKVDGSERKEKSKSKSKNKGKGKQVVLSDEEKDMMLAEELEKPIEQKKSKEGSPGKDTVDDEEANPFQDNHSNDSPPLKSTPEEVVKGGKENTAPSTSRPQPQSAFVTPRPSRPIPVNRDGTTPLYARYEIAPRRSSLPMSELIRRANSMPGSPFPTPHPTSASASKLKPLIARTPTSTAYSPYLKSSRSLLSKIAPLHPNRRTPPPPPPPPPPRKKSKKEIEMEEKWEEEMIEELGGMEEWAALTDAERREMRKVKWAREQGGWDE
ncbi:hypothetical protein JR316_0006270 [Psilocybe cubensis]|uniref:Uncharacterized protein n=2 Tax=Psilocybe cubensis TaxID=181762 RepID=A0A8H8CMZ5_PSICU|nr:hypothetical protein JR316_0006270 [Psilocybe cubensis]KAH9481743.1 hypothetical protein JR316_0006270 [Psilocybe cubensis]